MIIWNVVVRHFLHNVKTHLQICAIVEQGVTDQIVPCYICCYWATGELDSSRIEWWYHVRDLPRTGVKWWCSYTLFQVSQ